MGHTLYALMTTKFSDQSVQFIHFIFFFDRKSIFAAWRSTYLLTFENMLTAKFVVMFTICQHDRFCTYVSIYLLVIAMGPEAQLKHMIRDLPTLT